MLQTDIAIVGAGPAGAVAALKLSYAGIPCTLIDKAQFPRDKICGDALSEHVSRILARIDPAIAERLSQQMTDKVMAWGIRLGAPNKTILDIPLRLAYDSATDKIPAYIAKRIDFDHFLVREVQSRSNISFLQNTAINAYERDETGFTVKDKAGKSLLHTKLLIVANGAQSSFSRHIAGFQKDVKHQAAAVRAYYKNVGKLHPDNFLELYYLDHLTPGYLWIFPLPNGSANVGLGMRSDHVQRKELNLRKELERIVAEHPDFKDRFADAQLDGKIQGFPIPFGSKERQLSGAHYLLAGDAAYLVDPFSGEGIGNAVHSGFLAAEQAIKCLEANDFSAEFTEAYNTRITKALRPEMALSYRLQQVFQYPRIANFVANRMKKSPKLRRLATMMYGDLSIREQLVSPWFWFKFIFKREA